MPRNANELANQIIAEEKPKRVFTPEDAIKDTRWILANDRNQGVLEAYDDWLKGKGKKPQAFDGEDWTYPKDAWRNVLADKDYMTEVAKYLDDEYFDEEENPTDDQIEAGLKWAGYEFR